LPKRKTMPKELQQDLLRLCGGYTQKDSNIGAWLGKGEAPVTEAIVVYEVMCHRSNAAQVQEAIEREIRRQLDAGEEAVLLVKDGQGQLYTYSNPFN